jgi:hypothetical protein
METLSIFTNGKSVKPQEISLADLAKNIGSGTYRRDIERCRQILAIEGKAKYKDFRSDNVPHFASHAVLKTRAKGTDTERIIRFAGLCQIDFDGLTPDEIRRILNTRDPHVALSYISPSEKGAKILLRVPEAKDRAEYLAIAGAAERYAFKAWGIPPEHGTIIDPMRLCAVSHDPGVYVNESAEPITVTIPEGTRHETMKPIVASGVARGLDDADIFDEVRRQIPDPDKTDKEIQDLIDWCRSKQGEKPSQKIDEVLPAEMLASLDKRRFDHVSPPEKPVPLFSIGDAVIATAGNIGVISAQVKSGKTAVMSGFIGAGISVDVDEDLTFGITGKNTTGKAVIHFDTEQSRYDHFAVVTRAIRRGSLSAPPAFLRSYCVTDIDTRDRREMLRLEMERCAEIGVYAVMLDGVADFVSDPNDAEECFSFVAELHQLAIKYDCAILCVLHENPGTDYGKTRGHLGSQLERKAETNLRMAKDANEITTLWTEKARHCSIPKTKGVRFAYDTGRGYHVRVQSANDARASAAQDELTAFTASVFEGVKHGLQWHELRDKIIKLAGLSVPGAKKKIERMAEAGIIQKTLMNRYEFNA